MMPEFPALTVVEWTDATNIPTWATLTEIAEWAGGGGFICHNVGYLVYEDDECVVLAARLAFDAEPPQAGLYERIPKDIISNRWTVTEAKEQEDG